jgi:CRP/FNR family transcriptional regulator
MHEVEPKCAVCGQRAGSVFCELAGAHLDWLDREKNVYEYKAGQTVFYEGHRATAVYCISSGRVRLFKVGRKDEEMTIRLLGPSDIIGYRALLANEPYAATAEAIEPSTICVISKETIQALLKQSPELAMQMMASLSRELRVSEDQMISLLQENVRQRTARLLLLLFDPAVGSPNAASPSTLPLRRKDLAQMIGTTPESLSRTLRNFSDRGIIEQTKNTIRILKPQPLKRLADAGNDT